MQLCNLPNELLSLILANIDIRKLLLLRAVCTLWQQVIESLCHLTQSLYLFYGILGRSADALSFERLRLDQNDFHWIV